MNTQIDDLTLIKCLGKGSFGEVYLSSKRGKPGYFATKKISRSQADQPSMKKYLVNEIEILNSLHHPNIVRLEEVKQKNDFYYIVMEYINGGSLTDCLKSYQKKFGNSFPEEIVQYLMRQIVDAIKYIHNLKIIHRDLKLDNIMVNFDNDYDKNSLNMMKAKIKIIDFGFAIRLTKNNLAYTALGSPINMDPTILRKFSNRGQDLNSLGYDSKSDIWSLGTICYEMLIGKAVFNAETMNELVEKVEEGSYKVPTTVSSEIVSFLNGMLQFNSQLRFSADELSKHAFLTKRISDFTKINTKKVSKKIDKKDLNINIKRNKTIWSIFNKEDEQKLIKISPTNDYLNDNMPIQEEKYKKIKTDKFHKKNIVKGIKEVKLKKLYQQIKIHNIIIILIILIKKKVQIYILLILIHFMDKVCILILVELIKCQQIKYQECNNIQECHNIQVCNNCLECHNIQVCNKCQE